MTIEKMQNAVSDLSELSATMQHIKDLQWHKDSSGNETAMISLLADRLRAITSRFYDLEDEVVAGLSRIDAPKEEIKKAR
jgi:predicted  nucleic acid-binding Zn-ribbon protein